MSRIFLTLSRLANGIASFGRLHGGVLRSLAIVLAVALGFWGWMIKEPPATLEQFLTTLFRSFQLITLNFPDHIQTDIPWQLQIARLAVPLVAALATFHVLVGTLTRPLRIALLPHTREHIIVCGAERLTQAALEHLAKRGRQIVTLSASVDAARRDVIESLGITVFEGDPLLPATFSKLNLNRASALILSGDDDVANLNLALIALDAVRDRSEDIDPLILAVLIEREDLAAELGAALDRLSRHRRVRYHRLSPDREGLRLELARHAPALTRADRKTPSHVLIAGLVGHWRQILMQLVATLQDHPEERPLVTLLLDETERATFENWRAATPELGLIARCHVLPAAAAAPSAIKALARWRKTTPPPHLVVILREDADGLSTMLTLTRPGNAFAIGAVPVLVRQSREDHILARLNELHPTGQEKTCFVAFGGLIRADSIERVLDRKGEERAIAMHMRYLNDHGATAAGDAIQEWDALPENLREANRASAEHVPILLAALGLPPDRPLSPNAPELGPDGIEAAARIEHRRWCADRIDKGWRHGPKRDDARRLHPSLVPYEDLPEAEREKDRQTVRQHLGHL